ncbi:nudix hydrolase 3-like isoform X2 [Gossypium hirsutum]|uniref:Nudix hydrolase 3-like isoform X2 n=1 Tax=Gossypium hirsutum TaxID=3635 RepID=A0ABM3AP85_GOSHI|nr:nudix hydrolase 3-like isoform X2 [Gossypium hirsutum]
MFGYPSSPLFPSPSLSPSPWVANQFGQRPLPVPPSSRGDVHRDGDYHKAVHIWIFTESTQELLLQKRTDCKDSWPRLWDISSAGHISAGDSSLITAQVQYFQ